MDTDQVIRDLNRRFAAPLPEFYQRRIIFWHDEDKDAALEAKGIPAERIRKYDFAFEGKRVLIPASNEPSGCDSIHLANAARVTYPAALQRCKLDAPLLAAGLLTG